MLKHNRTLLLTLFVIGSISLAFIPFQVVWGQPERRCGRQSTLPLQGTFWVAQGRESNINTITFQADDANRIDHATISQVTQADLRTNSIFDRLPLQGGNLLAVLQQPPNNTRRDDIKTLRIFTHNGGVITLPENQRSDTLFWWHLLPKSEPNQFGIFGYAFGGSAFIVDVTFSADEFTIGEPHYLPFRFSPLTAQRLSISPDGAYISYKQPTESGELESFIYSLLEDRYIWRAPYNIDALIPVIWIPDSRIIAVVSSITRETDNQLVQISRSGESSVLIDLPTTYGAEVSLLPGGKALSSTQIAFMLNISRGQSFQLFMLDLMTQQFTDLCYSSETATGIVGVTPEGNILLKGNSSRFTIISPQTSDYDYLDLDGQFLIWLPLAE